MIHTSNLFDVFNLQEDKEPEPEPEPEPTDYDLEFPELGSKSPKPKPQPKPKSPIKLSTQQAPIPQVDEEPDLGFTLVTKRGEKKERKNDLRDDNYKTAMCKDIMGCKYGKKCRFAHSVEELRVRDCRFGNRCRKICNRATDPCNRIVIVANHPKCQRICQFKHPGETHLQCVVRRS